MGRGPVWGMITRRTGGAAGAAASAGASAWTTAAAGASVAGAGVAATGAWAAAGGWAVAATATAGAGAAAAGASTGGAAGGAGLAAGGAETTAGDAAWATAAGGRAITGPTGGLLAMAGAAGGATMFACGRGCGTMRRGCAGGGAAWEPIWGPPWDCGGAAAGVGAAAALGAAVATVTEDGGATTAVGRGGAALAAASACLRSRMALSASPGLETLERSNFGLVSTGCRVAVPLLPPFLKYSLTFSAWSASMELEWVFPVTPIASSASRIGLLFTSSSRAKSLIRTLLIRPFSVPCALSCSYQPHRGRNFYCKYYL